MDGIAGIGGVMDNVAPSFKTVLITRGHVTVRHDGTNRPTCIRGGQHWVFHAIQEDPHLSLFSTHFSDGIGTYHAAGLAVAQPSSCCQDRRESRSAAFDVGGVL
jgi:hypothetical protein